MSSVSYSPVLDESRATLRDIVSCSGAMARAAFWLYTCAAEDGEVERRSRLLSAALSGSQLRSSALS